MVDETFRLTGADQNTYEITLSGNDGALNATIRQEGARAAVFINPGDTNTNGLKGAIVSASQALNADTTLALEARAQKMLDAYVSGSQAMAG